MPIGETITLTIPEGKLFLRTIKAVVEFAESYPIEFQAFCNPETFKNVLVILGRAEIDVQAQIDANTRIIRISALALPALLDVEECLSAAKTARVENSRVALFTSIGGGVLSTILGFPLLASIASAVAVGVLVLGPFSKASQAPKEAIQPDVAEPTRGISLGRLGNGVQVQEKIFLERIIISGSGEAELHHWGSVGGVGSPQNGLGQEAESVCLEGPRYLVRVEGFRGIRVSPRPPWGAVSESRCALATRAITVWEDGGQKYSPFGGIPEAPKNSYWVSYNGPYTKGHTRFAGPFG